MHVTFVRWRNILRPWDVAALQPPTGRDLVLKTDELIGSVHFFPDDPADAVAKKALRVNLSTSLPKVPVHWGFFFHLRF